MKTIDLNCDLGEYYGKTSNNFDREIMPFISSCNIACGFHSGDPLTIEKTILSAMEFGVSIGAHPSFPDLSGFGRRVMQLSFKELRAVVRYQIAALVGVSQALNGSVEHVKPHGALYNYVAQNTQAAEAIVEAIVSVSHRLKLFGLPDSALEHWANKKGIQFIREGFVDRAYERDLSLRSRSLEGAVLHQESQVLDQAKNLVLFRQVKPHKGPQKKLEVQSLCLHSDTPNAASLAKSVYQILIENGVEIRHPQ